MKGLFFGKPLLVNNEPKGEITGVYLSKKYPEIKAVRCRLTAGETACVSWVGARIEDNGACFQRLRATLPQNFIKLSRGLPIYDEKGALLGVLNDLIVQNNMVLFFVTQEGNRYPYSMLKAVKDALILRKKTVFPLGEPLPAPLQRKNASPFVSKRTLENAVKKGELIQLTLSLSPFDFFGAI
ncbi:MAG: PRC-barrel domain-containing protein [Clostridia bacterium]|nr:PRC-barrel domain-containing protein [Clostridia bacterium]